MLTRLVCGSECVVLSACVRHKQKAYKPQRRTDPAEDRRRGTCTIGFRSSLRKGMTGAWRAAEGSEECTSRRQCGEPFFRASTSAGMDRNRHQTDRERGVTLTGTRGLARKRSGNKISVKVPGVLKFTTASLPVSSPSCPLPCSVTSLSRVRFLSPPLPVSAPPRRLVPDEEDCIVAASCRETASKNFPHIFLSLQPVTGRLSPESGNCVRCVMREGALLILVLKARGKLKCNSVMFPELSSASFSIFLWVDIEINGVRVIIDVFSCKVQLRHVSKVFTRSFSTFLLGLFKLSSSRGHHRRYIQGPDARPALTSLGRTNGLSQQPKKEQED
ncbi:hypothetical protein E2C01_014056 [Portunus trituberculatus]|uniref:Uncharacterized protein n=1 Tax=Portunus trituberculatus TaxID=210409 RepID=A0A5B7DJ00_PORTR|nr:hypothetical protein [Portunus trituberculatus]